MPDLLAIVTLSEAQVRCNFKKISNFNNSVVTMIKAGIRTKIIYLFLLFLPAFAGFGQSLDSLQQAYKKLPELKKNNSEDTTACYLLFQMVQTYTADAQMGLFSAPLKEISEKRLAELPKNHPLVSTYERYLVTAINDLGMFYREKGDAMRALDYFHKSLKVYETLHQQQKLAESYNNIATVYFDIGDKSKALEFYEKSYGIFKTLSDQDDLPQVLANLAYVNYVNNKFKKALDYYRTCLTICENMGDKKFISECINGMGLIYVAQGLYKEALILYTKSLKLREEINDLKGISTTLNNIGNCYRLQKKYHEALLFSTKSLAMSREIKSFERMRQSAFSLKDIYEKLGNYREALKMQELYILIRDSTNNEITRKVALTKQLSYEFDKKEIILKEEQARLKKLYEQKHKFYMILSTVLILLLCIVFLTLYFLYKFKKEKESKNLYIELKDRLKQEIKEKERIANSLIHIQEHEREKLAADLHDGVNQLLFAAKIQLQASKSVEEDMFKEAVNLVDSAINEIKSIATNQGSFLLKNKLLKDALTDLILQMKGHGMTQITFSNYGFEECSLNQDQKTNMLRIIQELLNNALKHAEAKNCYISVKTKAGSVIFAVTDNGKGIAAHKTNTGNGLKNINNKVSLMRGIQRTFSIPGKGSKIYIVIPLN